MLVSPRDRRESMQSRIALLEQAERIDLEHVEAVGHRRHTGVRVDGEDIGERVCLIDRDQEHGAVGARDVKRRCRSEGGFARPSLTEKQSNTRGRRPLFGVQLPPSSSAL